MRSLPLRRPLAVALALVLAALITAPASARPFPTRIDLPDGFQPEGITAGPGTSAYAGSLANGAIRRLDLQTGRTTEIVAGVAGRLAVGLDYEFGRHRLWVAGGPTGEVRAYDARSGALLRTYSLPTGTHGFLNDVAVTRTGVYVTDSNVQQLVVIPLAPGGALPPASSITTRPLTGDISYVGGFNANGIVAARGWLILVQSNTGMLFRVHPATGATREIALGGADVTFGDGLELRGSTLYVLRNFAAQVVVLKLGPALRAAVEVGTITGPQLDVPTTLAFSAGRLWTVNARFLTPPTPTTEYWATQLPAKP